ncbi:MAG: hypothetical protein ACOZD0_04450 [Pseudomonadota bacterium]
MSSPTPAPTQRPQPCGWLLSHVSGQRALYLDRTRATLAAQRGAVLEPVYTGADERLLAAALRIADEASTEAVISECVCVGPATYAPTDDAYGEVGSLAHAQSAVQQAVGWLLERRLAVLRQDTGGVLIVLLREPADATDRAAQALASAEG